MWVFNPSELFNSTTLRFAFFRLFFPLLLLLLSSLTLFIFIFITFSVIPIGVCVQIEDSFTVVVVEGVSKAIRRYEKLLGRRIDWTSSTEDDETLVDLGNKCTCVWSGTTPSPTFSGKFRFETIRSVPSARKRFNDVGLAHFFDAAEASVAAVDEAALD